MLKLAIRNVVRYRGRTLLTLMAIALGVAALVLAGGFVKDVYVQLGEATIHSQLGHLQIYREGYYARGARRPLEYMMKQADKVALTVRGHPAVQEAMQRLNFFGLLNNGRTDAAVMAEGVEPDAEQRLGSFVTILQGRQLKSSDQFGVLVGEGLARSLSLAPGSHVALLTNTTEGVLNSADLEVVGIFRSFSKDYDNHAARLPLAAARELLGTEGANAVVVVLRDTADTAVAARDLKRVLTPEGVEILAWDELSDFYRKTIELYKRQFGVLQIITLIMVVLSVTNAVNMTTFERAGEFGTMRALGDRARKVFNLVVLENVVLAVAGAVVGVVGGIVLALVISAVGIPMPPPPNAESGYTAFIRLEPLSVAGAFLVGLVATLIAALWPARRMMRMELPEALRQNI